jgi:hypothetical protein
MDDNYTNSNIDESSDIQQNSSSDEINIEIINNLCDDEIITNVEINDIFNECSSPINNQRIPNQRSPNQRSPNQRSPNRRIPNRRIPNQRIPNRRIPNQSSPNRRIPNRLISNVDSPNRRSNNRLISNVDSPNRRIPNRLIRNVDSPNNRLISNVDSPNNRLISNVDSPNNMCSVNIRHSNNNTNEYYRNHLSNMDIVGSYEENCEGVELCNHSNNISDLNRKLKDLDRNIKQSKIQREKSFFHNKVKSKKNRDEFNINTDIIKSDNVPIMIDPSLLISEHLNEMQLRMIGHTRAAILYEKKEKILGFPVTIISSFTTSSIMLDMTKDNDKTDNSLYYIKYISLILSIISFVFSILRDYLNYAKRFQSHDLSSKLYTTLVRSVEVRLIKTHLSKEDRQDIFKDIVDQMSIIEQYETPIPHNILARVRKEVMKIV